MFRRIDGCMPLDLCDHIEHKQALMRWVLLGKFGACDDANVCSGVNLFLYSVLGDCIIEKCNISQSQTRRRAGQMA